MARVTGNGAIIRFWHDVWCLDVPMMVQFGRLFALASNQNSLVSDYWSPTGWVFAWRRDIRGGVEQEQLTSLMSLLDDYHLGVELDKWVWNLDNSGHQDGVPNVVDTGEVKFKTMTFWMNNDG
ncbi:unnamed protein product [Lactuca virosa]|uniref:Reverse transcriptase zinc-binding domain-containing protein n=1 Tax=Lactuca virosa TaxID=75947 RepID=A0AAU9LCC9_9ASTR|nr:unnamed protein product [Lactuca virosa]